MTEPPVRGAASAVIWHDLECGAYSGDLAAWEYLAAESGGPLLDLGCGTGRVALYLARAGHQVLGIDREPAFVAELNRRALRDEVPASADLADVRTFDLGEARFGLVLAPMQLLQLLDGEEERGSCLRRIARHLRRGACAALAITDVVEAPSSSPPPLPDVREVDGRVYSSLPIALRRTERGTLVSRLRQTVSPQGMLSEERSEVLLADLGPNRVEAEAAACGLRPHARISVPPTPDHVGSTIVVLEAP